MSFKIYADFSGNWSGKGNYFLKDKNGQCTNIELSFYQDGQNIIFRGGRYICDDIEAEYEYTILKNINGNLFFDGKNCGKISKDYLLLFDIESGYKLELKIIDKFMNFTETWTENNQLAFSIIGQLKKL
ncbi:MAG: hypothetical protein H6622_11655 [Halobacteriovoraceae bacterium]|nr:hypothetical protein [Halobacteriovoraceae bacterium]